MQGKLVDCYDDEEGIHVVYEVWPDGNSIEIASFADSDDVHESMENFRELYRLGLIVGYYDRT